MVELTLAPGLLCTYLHVIEMPAPCFAMRNYRRLRDKRLNRP
jgi:hypothetical protein